MNHADSIPASLRSSAAGAGEPLLQSLRRTESGDAVEILDQTRLPRERVTVSLRTLDDAALAIRTMQVRGAPLIGVTAAYGLALSMQQDSSDAGIEAACLALLATRPTAINLRWALERVRAAIQPVAAAQRAHTAWREADAIAAEDIATNRAIGEHGLPLINALAGAGKRPVRILTHCNAGALATLGWGTATAPIYLAHAAGIAVHVWVSETRPRLQGAKLTSWEMHHYGVPHSLIVDSAGAALMQRGEVDLVFVGADRVTRNGDVCNKVGTYEKALAAHDCGVPFYVALPSTTIDWTLAAWRDIPIEQRAADEVLRPGNGDSIAPDDTPVANPAFDVTPARLVTGLITERGVCAASAAALTKLFPECAR